MPNGQQPGATAAVSSCHNQTLGLQPTRHSQAESQRADSTASRKQDVGPCKGQSASIPVLCFPAEIATKQLKVSQLGSLVKSPLGIFPLRTLAPAHSHDNTAVPRGSCGMGAAKVGVPCKTQGRKLQSGPQSSVRF